MKDPIIIRVTWYDAHAADKWLSILDAQVTMSEIMLCETIGYLLHKDKECIVIAHTIVLDEKCPVTCGIMHIPRKCIKSIIEVKL
jgi:hypothetical protein